MDLLKRRSIGFGSFQNLRIGWLALEHRKKYGNREPRAESQKRKAKKAEIRNAKAKSKRKRKAKKKKTETEAEDMNDEDKDTEEDEEKKREGKAASGKGRGKMVAGAGRSTCSGVVYRCKYKYNVIRFELIRSSIWSNRIQGRGQWNLSFDLG